MGDTTDAPNITAEVLKKREAEIETRLPRERGLKYKICHTIAILMAPVATGLFVELVGPTMPDLITRVQTDYEAMSRTLVARSAGQLISSVGGGFITSKISDDAGICLSVGLLLGAVGSIAAPWSGTLILLTLCLFLQGLANGTVDTLSTYFCTNLWHRKATVPLHALHFGYGVGALLAPQLALPFIAKLAMRNRTLSYDNNTSFVFNTSEVHDVIQMSRIEIAYGISGFFTVIVGLVIAIFYTTDKLFKGKNKIPICTLKDNTIATPRKKKPQDICSGRIVIRNIYVISMLMLVFNSNGGQCAFSKFLFTFATEGDLKMTDVEAAALNSVFWLSFSSGRGIALLLSRWIPPNPMLIIDVILNIISGVFLFVWGDKMPLMLWINTCIFGFTSGPMIPTGFACMNLYLVLDGALVSVMFIFIAGGPLLYQWITGYLFELYGPHVQMPIMLTYSISTLAILVVMCIALKYLPKRFNVVEAETFDEKVTDTDSNDQCDNGTVPVLTSDVSSAQNPDKSSVENNEEIHLLTQA